MGRGAVIPGSRSRDDHRVGFKYRAETEHKERRRSVENDQDGSAWGDGVWNRTCPARKRFRYPQPDVWRTCVSVLSDFTLASDRDPIKSPSWIESRSSRQRLVSARRWPLHFLTDLSDVRDAFYDNVYVSVLFPFSEIGWSCVRWTEQDLQEHEDVKLMITSLCLRWDVDNTQPSVFFLLFFFFFFTIVSSIDLIFFLRFDPFETKSDLRLICTSVLALNCGLICNYPHRNIFLHVRYTWRDVHVPQFLIVSVLLWFIKINTATTGKPLEQTSLIQINKYLHRHINIGASTSIRYTHSTDIGALGKYERRKKNPVVFFFLFFLCSHTRALKIIWQS